MTEAALARLWSPCDACAPRGASRPPGHTALGAVGHQLDLHDLAQHLLGDGKRLVEHAIDQRITLEIAQNNEMRLADAPVNLRGLAGALKKMKAALPDAKIELKADDDVSLQLLLQVWEILTEQGFPIKDVPVRVQVN